ncbi:rhomboid family-domain-containing protein [Schizophyllum amplum]|uniref:Rhomboid-type serine protease n=1 Tax=Schizophyllum amplum TaxID=97359 RepID=A0A550C604_9AGAR|nr:rhomboid family-domain-containing protein [Auriculariopsis ampla]
MTTRLSTDHFGDGAQRTPFEEGSTATLARAPSYPTQQHQKAPSYDSDDESYNPYRDSHPTQPQHAEDEAFDHTKLDGEGANVYRAPTTKSGTSYAPSRPLTSYVDENFNYYNAKPDPQSEEQDASLMQNAAGMGGKRGSRMEGMGYQDPYAPQGDKKRGIGRQRHPFVVWALTAAMVGVMIYECVVNYREQGNPVSFKPTVNVMLGPSSAALINVGARFPPCMKLVDDIPPSFELPCMNATDLSDATYCTVEELCGFGGFGDEDPNQWFRFITPIFLHAGIVHLLLNMFAQVTVSAQIEREMGSGGFFLTYFAAGIFGNILGGNFALVGIPSVGASGAIFGTVAVTWVDLFAHWKYQYRPVRKLIFMIIELGIGIAVGFIPYVDNFGECNLPHLGGFLLGLLVGTIFYPVISETKRHKFIMWAFRIAAIPFAIVLFVVLTRNFYTSDPYAACAGCRYLSCWPTDANNHCKGTGLTNTTTTTTTNNLSTRMLLGGLLL